MFWARLFFTRHSERGKKTRQTEKKMWEDNIREWTGLEFAKSKRAVETRENWRELVVKLILLFLLLVLE